MGISQNSQVEAPIPPTAPTVGGSIQDFISGLPALLESSREFQPQFAALSQDIARQLNPETFALQEDLAGQAREGISGELPEDVREAFRSEFSGALGTNVGSPIGAEATSLGLLGFREQRQQQFRNLGLAVTGRQALTQAPGIQGAMGGFNPGQALGFNQGIFGTQGGIFGTQAGMFNQQGINQTAMRGQNLNFASNVLGSAFTAGT